MIEKTGRGRPKGGSKAALRAVEVITELSKPEQPHQELRELLDTLEAAYEHKRSHKMEFYEPYPKQAEFFEAGIWATERLLIAGNQLGKTEAGAFEMACHLTGIYPDWWLGRRFERPVKAWAASISGVKTREGCQLKLCGEPGVKDAFGTGYIPKRCFVEYPSLSRGVANLFDTVQVKHITGGISTLTFLSYEQGWEKFSSATLDCFWCDEEPENLKIYTECVARITATKGMGFMTFTPLYGWTDLVNRFLKDDSKDRFYVTMTANDVSHLTAEEVKKMEERYPRNERDARLRGVPMMGSGRIFTIDPDNIIEPMIPFDYIPHHWRKLWGIDFGILHPFAAVLIAHDRDNDVIHILHTIRIKDQLPLNHAAAMKPIGAAVPVAWPQDGTARERGSGEPLAALYKAQGLRMLGNHSTFEDGSISTEAGVNEMTERMVTGRLKVAAHLTDWLEEYAAYHRDEKGMIVKIKDDLLSATRVALMAKRFAQTVPLGPHGMQRRRREEYAVGHDANPWG